MAQLKEVVKFLDKELRIKKIKDSSRNGLQVKASSGEIKKIGFAVDACLSTFEKAKKAKVELLIVHHGLIWKKEKGKYHLLLKKKRINFLKKSKISLYAAHLPLDLHEKYGNNILLVKLIKLTGIKKFGNYHWLNIGYTGKFRKPTTLHKISATLNKKLKTKCTVVESRKTKIKSVCIISGRGTSLIAEAVKKKIDCFLTGEMDHEEAAGARDSNLSMITAGHYATETLGVKALMQLLQQKFKVKTIFIEDGTGL